ncbi:BrnA antitoxin family protein [Thiothrix subterranea]|uniref:BrnA antitoxin family protein n=1 Tax=Thiothrix subterranea TaxID=2735563 RepID=UPI00192B161A|nr:BrnA antitoxin family protein [Thiothrix subterranea]QQZ27335.1 BrnA antitoxin family protein [Thiothrix subterranea]
MKTEADKEWEYLVNMPDEEIDFSDIPKTTAEMWKNAEVGKFYRPVKKQGTVRIDADILAWLQSDGAGYQTRLNQLLRDAMLQAPKKPGELEKIRLMMMKTCVSFFTFLS